MKYFDLLNLIKTGEGYTLELKESLTTAISKDICAFTNASGGKIILGVKDDGTIKGCNLTNKQKSMVQNIARNMDPSYHVFVENIDQFAVIYVPDGKEKPYAINGHFYLRQGASSQQLKRDEIRNLFQKENLIKFDIKSNTKYNLKKDFNNIAFKKFIQKANIDKNLSKEHILENLGLITEEKLNNTGVLFFSKEISKFFLNSIIGCVLYEGTTRVKILDKRENNLDFLSNFNSSLIFLQRNLRTEYIIEKAVREEKLEVSEKVLRELIINAMTHRNYFSEGRILIEIFSNRIEISNPGSLLFKKSDFGRTSLSRNPLIADLSHRLGFVERMGSGINRVKEIMKDKIEFEITEDWFRVIINRKKIDTSQKPAKNQPKTSQKSAQTITPEERKKLILEAIKNNKFTKRSFAKDLNIKRSTIEYDLIKLKEEGKIERIGPRKGGYWKIIV